ncbi:MAG: NADH-quinone oxidoreductase subunit NuoK [Planctomycetia bacterium]|nr:NADH-quinone oxidoreductase subunit NuoK [Planctomycetia bacterium]
MLTLQNCLLLSALVFATGVFGVIARRNALIVLMSVELMLNAVNIAFVAFARFYPGTSQSVAGHLEPAKAPAGHIFVLLTMAVAAAEAAVGLAIVLAWFRNRKTTDTEEMRNLRW